MPNKAPVLTKAQRAAKKLHSAALTDAIDELVIEYHQKALQLAQEHGRYVH